MTRIFTNQEIEQLSAYLDGKLPVREKMLLELRLRDEPELQKELNTFAKIHLALRSLPRRRVPHNFTLTPAMLPRRGELRLFPAFRLATALAGILLVLAFAGDLLLGGAGMGAAPIPSSSMPVANQAEKMAAPSNQQALITWNSPTPEAYALGGGNPESPTLAETEASANVYQPALPTETETQMALAMARPESPTPARAATQNAVQPSPTRPCKSTPTSAFDVGSMSAGNPTATATETPTETPTETLTSTATETPTATATETETPTLQPPPPVAAAPGSPILGVSPAYPPQRQGYTAPAAVPQPQLPSHAIFRWLEVIMGAVLLGAGMAAFVFYRKERR